MRLWSLHPHWLDPKGLVAAWREGLLARAVLGGRTRGYQHHPQLERFRAHPTPRLAINAWLAAIHDESIARAVLGGRTRGYQHHPQLERFRAHPTPRLAINAWLAAIHDESIARGYAFDRSRFGTLREVEPIPLTRGQLEFEWTHLLDKLARRSPTHLERMQQAARPTCHPLFRLRPGPVASWERAHSD